MLRTVCCLFVAITFVVSSTQAGVKFGLKEGTPDIKSAGPLAFGPDGILFIGDPRSAAIFAVATGDTSGDVSKAQLKVNGIGEKIAGLLGTTTRDIRINDLAVNPLSGNAYLSVTRGQGPEGIPVVVRVDAKGELSDFSLKKVSFSKATLPNPVADRETGQGRRKRNKRIEAITDMAFVDGRLIVAGLSNEDFASRLRSIPFPFDSVDKGAGVEIFHGAHGKLETRSPVQTFVSFDINAKTHLLAAYQCTPLVKFPLSDLKPGSEVRGTTVAELGNRNKPFDMIVYKKGGDNFLLIANSSRGVMKVTTKEINSVKPINERIGGTAGLSYDTIDELKGVFQLDRLNDENAVVLVRSGGGAINLQTVALP